MRQSGVYVIRNRQDGTTYVGSSVDVPNRWREHRGSLTRGQHVNKALQAAWDRDGAEGFDFELLEVVDELNARYAREKHHLRVVSGQVYNISKVHLNGPAPGFQHSAETVEKLRALHKGIPKSEAHKAKLSAAKKGKPCPAQADAIRGRKASPETRAKMSATKKKWYQEHERSAETRAKLSLTSKGRVRTPETIEKQRSAMTGRKLTAEHKAKIIATGRKLSPEIVAKRLAIKQAALALKSAQSPSTSTEGRGNTVAVSTPEYRQQILF